MAKVLEKWGPTTKIKNITSRIYFFIRLGGLGPSWVRLWCNVNLKFVAILNSFNVFFFGNFLNSTWILNLKFNHLGPPKINGYLENIFFIIKHLLFNKNLILKSSINYNHIIPCAIVHHCPKPRPMWLWKIINYNYYFIVPIIINKR